MIKDLYLHIPFCSKRCPYCDFYSSTRSDLEDTYIDKLIDEYNFYKDQLDKNLSTIYLGGGTPSIVKPRNLERVFNRFRENHDLSSSEITIEINPGEVTKDKLSLYKDLGINRLSVGVQSINSDELKQLGRVHTDTDIYQLFEWIKLFEFSNYSLDLIIGTPTQTIKSFEQSLSFVEKIDPPHLSAYILTYYQGTKYKEMVDSGRLKPMDDDSELHYYNTLIDRLEGLGLDRYEISNYAKKGLESKHNSNVWRYGDYLGLGASAHSKVGSKRWANISNIERYIHNFDDKEVEIIDSDDRENEMIMLYLRTVSGIVDRDLLARLSKSRKVQLDRFSDLGLIRYEPAKISLTRRGFELYNSVVSELFL